MSRIQSTNFSLDDSDRERQRFADFAENRADPVYREISAHLYRCWREFNQAYFGCKLKEPHLTYGLTPPRSLGVCQQFTDFGGRLQITIAKRVVFGSAKTVVNPWPAPGLIRFVEDILLHEMIHQYQFEVSKQHERSYRGHGQHFCRHCNRIGEQLGLQSVIVRKRGKRDDGLLTCNHWPHAVRSVGYYLGDILEFGVKPSSPLERPTAVQGTHYQEVISRIARLIERGNPAALTVLLRDELELAAQYPAVRLPFSSTFQEAQEDTKQ